MALFGGPFGAWFARYGVKGQVGKAGRDLLADCAGNARRNPLKTGRLEVFKFVPELPSFWQARHWQKRETLGVILFSRHETRVLSPKHLKDYGVTRFAAKE